MRSHAVRKWDLEWFGYAMDAKSPGKIAWNDFCRSAEKSPEDSIQCMLSSATSAWCGLLARGNGQSQWMSGRRKDMTLRIWIPCGEGNESFQYLYHARQPILHKNVVYAWTTVSIQIWKYPSPRAPPPYPSTNNRILLHIKSVALSRCRTGLVPIPVVLSSAIYKSCVETFIVFICL